MATLNRKPNGDESVVLYLTTDEARSLCEAAYYYNPVNPAEASINASLYRVLESS